MVEKGLRGLLTTVTGREINVVGLLRFNARPPSQNDLDSSKLPLLQKPASGPVGIRCLTAARPTSHVIAWVLHNAEQVACFPGDF